jgi:hypothetical protein
MTNIDAVRVRVYHQSCRAPARILFSAGSHINLCGQIARLYLRGIRADARHIKVETGILL